VKLRFQDISLEVPLVGFPFRFLSFLGNFYRPLDLRSCSTAIQTSDPPNYDNCSTFVDNRQQCCPAGSEKGIQQTDKNPQNQNPPDPQRRFYAIQKHQPKGTVIRS
jgi:hypothetical protein